MRFPWLLAVCSCSTGQLPALDAGQPIVARGSLACVLERDGEVSLDAVTRGCFGGTDNRLHLEHGDAGFWMTGFAETDIDLRARVHRHLSSREAHFVLDEIQRIRDTPMSDRCRSTGKYKSHLVVRCDGAETVQTFESYACGDGVGGTRPQAEAFLDLVRHVVSQQPNEKGPLTPDEKQAYRRKWGALYRDGYRVRHDPTEDWEEEDGGAVR